MRRITTLAAAAAVLTPLLLVNTGSASAASGDGTLTVTRLGRNGKPVSSSLSVYNTGTCAFTQLSSGRAHSLAKGTYQVFVDIWGADGRPSSPAAPGPPPSPTRPPTRPPAGSRCGPR